MSSRTRYVRIRRRLHLPQYSTIGSYWAPVRSTHKRYQPSSATLAQVIAKARAATANTPNQTRSSRLRGGVFQEWAILHLAMCSRTRRNHKIWVGRCPIIGEP